MNAQPVDERSYMLALDEYRSLMKEAGKDADPEYFQTLNQLGQSERATRPKERR